MLTSLLPWIGGLLLVAATATPNSTATPARSRIHPAVRTLLPGGVIVRASWGDERLSNATVQVVKPGPDQEFVASGNVGERLTLPAGTYDLEVIASEDVPGARTWVRGVTVEGGRVIEQTVRIPSGPARLAVTLIANGEPADAELKTAVSLNLWQSGRETMVTADETAFVTPGEGRLVASSPDLGPFPRPLSQKLRFRPGGLTEAVVDLGPMGWLRVDCAGAESEVVEVSVRAVRPVATPARLVGTDTFLAVPAGEWEVRASWPETRTPPVVQTVRIASKQRKIVPVARPPARQR